MEEYLRKDFDVYENESLDNVDKIEDYFKDWWHEFDCGQGYYDESITKTVKIGDKFYEVVITAEIESSKQDRGDRLYYVEGIESVTYKEIPKPLPKQAETFTYTFYLNKDKRLRLDEFIKDNAFDLVTSED